MRKTKRAKIPSAKLAKTDPAMPMGFSLRNIVGTELARRYAKFAPMLGTPEFRILCDYLLANRGKLVWAIEDLDAPPIEGVGRKLVDLPGVDFHDPNIRRFTGALVACILADEYEPVTSGHRITWRPFVTASKYKRIKKTESQPEEVSRSKRGSDNKLRPRK